MWLKWTKYIAVFIGISVSLIVGTLVIITSFYEDEIKKYAIDELNSHLKSKVDVKSIDLTILDNFPQISLKFKDVLIADDFDENDSLFYSEYFYLSFDLLDVLNKKYNVKQISSYNAYVNLKVNDKGHDNFNIWKSDTIENSNNIKFTLSRLRFDKLRLKYSNVINAQSYSFNTENIILSGNFNKNIFTLTAISDLQIETFSSSNIEYLNNKQAEIDVKLKIDNEKDIYSIIKASVIIEKLNFDLVGDYKNKKAPTINIDIKGNNINIASLPSIFHFHSLYALEEYNAIGDIEFSANIKGGFSSNKLPEINAKFSIKSGSLEEIITETEITEIRLEGLYSSLEENLEVSSFSANLYGDKIKGTFSILNFSSPRIQGNISGDLGLEKLAKFSKLKEVLLSGSLSCNLDFSLLYNKTSENYNIKKLQGQTKLNNIGLELPKYDINISDLNGTLTNQSIKLVSNKLNGKLNESNFKTKFTINNFIDYITLKDDKLNIIGSILIKELSLDKLISSNSSNNDTNNIFYYLPKLNIDLNIDNLYFQKIKTKKIKGKLITKPNYIKFENMSFKANEGLYTFSSLLKPLDITNYSLYITGSANDIDIKSLYYQTDNFGQTFITHKNLEGIASLNFIIQSNCDFNWNFNADDMLAEINIEISKGKLIEHQTMSEIATYLGSNKLIKTFVDTEALAKKVKRIKFSKLSNTILINNSNISIPKMDIKSSLLNIEISGEHSFSDSINYHFNFRLKDALMKQTSSNFGELEDDNTGRRIFLRMFGTIDNPEYELDKQEKKLAKKEAIEDEKQEIKSVLKQEFGLFSNDSSVKELNKEAVPVSFEVNWEEDTESEENKIELDEEEKASQKEKKKSKWLKKLGVEEKKEEKAVFEIDN
jgi:hypothetical protein